MNAFLLLYAMAISIELMLSLLMALFLYLILAPAGRPRDVGAAPSDVSVRPLARHVEVALSDAFATVSTGRDDLPTITNARSLLVQYENERTGARSSRA